MYAYSAYGEPAYGDWGGSRFRYTGQIMLPEVKLYHYKGRAYDPILGRFLQTDPVGYSDDLNLYGYVNNDLMGNNDPSGLARVCTDSTGSHIPACVDVDGNGDGNSKDHDLTMSQIESLGNDFHSFIVNHNGDDLSKNGADVFGDGATSQNGNFIRAVSQFVGSASGGWNGVGIQMGNSKTMRVLSGNQNLDSSDAGIATVLNNHPVIGLNTDVSATFASGGNAARALLHESLHLKYPGFEFTVSSHQWIDTEARRLLKVYGLGDGGCNAVGGLFGTDWFASFPACK